MPDPVIEGAVAIVPVRDITTTTNFYQNILDFEIDFLSEDERYCIMKRNHVAMHFMETDNQEALYATANHISVYLNVKELDMLYEELKPKLRNFPQESLRPPAEQHYGMREFHIKDPDGCLLMFGEDTVD